MELRFTSEISIIKESGKMDINMDKGSYNFRMAAIVREIF